MDQHALINPDTRRAATAVTALVWILLCAAFAGSASALLVVTRATGVPAWLAWVGPVILDGAIVTFNRVALVMRQRGHRGRVRVAWAVVVATTSLSSLLNLAHAVDLGVHGWVGLGGRVVAGYYPLLVLLASWAVEAMTVATPQELAADAARAAATAQAEADAADAARIDAARRAAAVRVAVAQAEAEADAALAELTADGATTASTPTPAPTTPSRQPRSTERPTAPVAPRARVTVDDALRDRIIRMHQEGASERTIAAACGVGKSTVHRVTAGVAVGGPSPLEAVA